MHNLFNQDSKIWEILKILVIGFVLWLNASNFDETEIRAILEIGAAYYGLEKLKDNKKE